MTTQHSYSEHSDVDASVVEDSHASETTTPTPSSTVAASNGEHTPVESTPPDAQLTGGPGPQALSASEAQSGSFSAPDSLARDETPNDVDATSEMEVKPFTAFIEEFRQTEARFHQATQELQEAQEETTLTTEPTIYVETFKTAETSATTSPPITEAAEAKEAAPRPISPLLRPARLRVPRHNTRHRDEARTPTTEGAAQPEAQITQPVPTVATDELQETPGEPMSAVEQPRPARRYRFDRPAQTPTPPTPADTSVTSAYAQIPSTASGIEREMPQLVKPAPTIAYQPEQSLKQTPAPEPGDAEITAIAQPAIEPERRRKHGQDRQRGKEQAAQHQQPQQPAAIVDNSSALNVQSSVAPEPVAVQKDEIEPEDLPPLEYAELQKANTHRRRRRHVNGASVATLTGTTPVVMPAKPVTAEAPVAPPQIAQSRAIAPQPAVPQRPAVTQPPVVATNAANYTITSGFTVNQMNQGNDNVGPFMGPEPSPARGTMAAQNVRSIRSDAQRTPAYPVRSTEATSASVNQLANIVSQAIQTQTDRMVAELRRANQSPTNISVTMPPFPSNERVGVFVDVANLLYSARTLRMAVDFGKLLDFLRGNRRLIRAHAYCPTSPQPGDEQMFLQAVKGLGYRITTKNYKTFASGAKKADLDLDLCMDIVRLVDGRAVDCVVLVSGDSDFMPVLDYCSDHGVRVEVAAFDEAMSGTLRQSCDLFINLSMLDENSRLKVQLTLTERKTKRIRCGAPDAFGFSFCENQALRYVCIVIGIL